jgi:hypothetical protein
MGGRVGARAGAATEMRFFAHFETDSYNATSIIPSTIRTL